MVMKIWCSATASIVPSLVLIFFVGFAVTYYQLQQAQFDNAVQADDSSVHPLDFEPIETALLTSEYTPSGVALSEHTERALRQAVLAFPDTLSSRQFDRIKWLSARINPLHGEELTSLLVRYRQYLLDAEGEGRRQVSGVQQLQRLIRLQHQHFGRQTAQQLFPSQHALLDVVSARGVRP